MSKFTQTEMLKPPVVGHPVKPAEDNLGLVTAVEGALIDFGLLKRLVAEIVRVFVVKSTSSLIKVFNPTWSTNNDIKNS